MKSRALVAFLVLSVAGNLFLILLLLRPDPKRVERRKPTGLGLTADAGAHDMELVAVRRQAATLELQVEDLERARVETAFAAAALPDRVAELRGRFRQVFKWARGDGPRDVEGQLDEEIAYAECEKAFLKPAANAGRYAQAFQAWHEGILEEQGAPLSDTQKGRFGGLVLALEEALRKVPAGPAGERQIQEIELERDFRRRFEEILEPGQREELGRGNPLGPGIGVRSNYVLERNTAVRKMADDWAVEYEFPVTHRHLVDAAAVTYVQALTALEQEHEARHGTRNWKSGPESHEYRIRALRAQLEARRQLEPLMSPERQEHMRAQDVTEYTLYDKR